MTAESILTVILLLLLVAIYFIARRSGSLGTASVLPVHRHWMIRWLGGLLAVGLLVALGVGTWRASGPRDGGGEGKILRPSREPASLRLNPDDSWETVTLPPCRLIFTFGVVRRHNGQSVPLLAESKVIEWPADRGREVSFHQSVGGLDFTCDWTPSDMFQQSSGAGKPILHVRGSRQRTAQGSGVSWSSSNGGWSEALDKASHELVREVGGYGHEPLSLVPMAEDDLWLISEVRRADADDPLKEEPASMLAGPMVVDEWTGGVSRGRRMGADAPPGARMMAYIGPASALLLLVALAGAQVFRRRGPAFVALLALMVLFAGTMDLVVWERRAAIVTDTTRPESERVSSMLKLSHHFFHTGRTERYLESLRSAKETSPSFRDEIERALRESRP